MKYRSRYVILSADDYSFTFNYMHPGSYYLYALYDADGNNYFSSGDKASFPGSTFTLSEKEQQRLRHKLISLYHKNDVEKNCDHSHTRRITNRCNNTACFAFVSFLQRLSTRKKKLQQVFEGKKKAFIYARWSHPNAEIVEQKMEALQTTKKTKALAFNSGMAAISAVFQSLVKPKDVLIVQGNIYGTTVDYVNELAKQMDLQVYFVDFKKTDEIVRICTSHKKVKLFYAESPSNPTIECYDIKKLAGIAHQYGAKLAVDNTFATPLLQQPIALGLILKLILPPNTSTDMEQE